MDPVHNVALTMIQMRQPHPLNMSTTNEWLMESYGSDPIVLYLRFAFLIFVILNLQIWFYSNMASGRKIKKAFCLIFRKKKKANKVMPDIHLANVVKNHNEKFLETKSSILGTSQTGIMVILGILAVLPVNISKAIAKENIEVSFCNCQF